MELSLTARVQCRGEAQRAFALRMLDGGPGRPAREDELAAADRPGFRALECLAPPESAGPVGNHALHASWTVADEDALAGIVQALKALGVVDVYAAMESDEGWCELWVLEDARLRRHEAWHGQPVSALIEGVDDLLPLLEALRAANRG